MFDRVGEYEVTVIGSSFIRGRYLNETTDRLWDRDLKERIHAAVLAEQKPQPPSPLKYAQPLYQEFITYLKDHAWIWAEIPYWKLDSFQRRYYAVTGEWVNDDHPGVCVHELKVWSYSLRIKLPADAREHVPMEFNLYENSSDPTHTRLTLSCNALCWELFEMGFRLGQYGGFVAKL